MFNKRQRLGQSGEKLAALFLKKKGYKIIEKNYRSRFGEIDIIARDRKCLVFIEVKTRSSAAFGTPATSVDYRKQQQISKTAHAYLLDKQMADCDTRFDVVGITLQGTQRPQVELFINAFDFCL